MPTSTKVSSTSWLRCRAFGLCVALSACSTGDLPSLGVCDECYVFDPDYHSKRAKLRGRAARATCTDFVVDSGATLHCINDKSMFETVYTDQQRVTIKVADGKTIEATAVGTVRLKLLNTNGQEKEYLLHNVVYSPFFSANLLSVRRLWKDHHIKTTFAGRNRFKDKTTGDIFNFSFDGEFKLAHQAFATKREVPSEIVHQRFGHCRQRRLDQMKTRSQNFPNHGDLTHDNANCDACNEGNMHRHPFPKRTKQKFTYFGERLSSDTVDVGVTSVDGYRYALCVIDSATNICFLYLMKTKSAAEVKDGFEAFLTKLQI